MLHSRRCRRRRRMNTLSGIIRIFHSYFSSCVCLYEIYGNAYEMDLKWLEDVFNGRNYLFNNDWQYL